LIKDYKEIVPNALTMLVNLSGDDEVVKSLIDDNDFMESLLRRVTVRQNSLPKGDSKSSISASTNDNAKTPKSTC